MNIFNHIKLLYAFIALLFTFTSVHSSHPLNSVYFADSSRGWVAGNSGVILKTTDGGTSWEMQDINNIADYKAIHHVFFINSDTGWACGSIYDYNYGYVLLFRKTTDGGTNWDEIDNPLKGPMYFTDPDTGWSCHEFTANTIHKTTNGGLHWQEQLIDPLSNDLECPHSFFFTDPGTGWALCSTCYDTKIFKTSNGGESWIEQNSNTTNKLNAICFIDSSTGWICGDNGTVLVTSDGGNNWLSHLTFPNIDLLHICFYDNLKGWISAESEIYKTTTSGLNWTKIDLSGLGNTGTITALHFSDSETAWAVTSNGYIIKVTDDTATVAKYLAASEITPYYYDDSCGNCGSSSQLAFIPAISCGLLSLLRRVRRKRKVRK